MVNCGLLQPTLYSKALHFVSHDHMDVLHRLLVLCTTTRILTLGYVWA